MNRILLLLCFFTICFIHSQEMPIDFSDSADIFQVFGGSGFIQRGDPTDGSNTVGEFFNDGSDANQGFYIDLSRSIDLSNQSTLSLSFYAFDPIGHTITLKLEQGNGVSDLEVTKSTQTSTGWEENIVFDFGTNTGSYNRLTIFIDAGSTQTGTYLIDNINDGSEATDPNDIDVVYDVLAWSDEFDIDGPVDSTKWYHQTTGPNGGQWFNGELQHYTNRTDNSYVSNGNLIITAKRETFFQDGITLDYTSARLNSKFAFTYGRVDVRAKLPAGNGTWPAIWTLGKNISEVGAYWQTQGFGTTPWPACGEIDIMEHGLHAVNEVSSAIHTPSSSGATVNTETLMLQDVANNFHVYSMNWSPNQITFLVDDVPFYTYKPSLQDTNTWPFNLEQYLLLNVAMGGFSGTIDSNFTESSMVIDYVRVYQSAEILAVQEFSEFKLEVYPNPTSDFINIKSVNTITNISITNLLGKTILKQKVETLNHQINTRNIASGIYLLKVTIDGNQLTKKIIIK